ncbi:MAG: ABC transporter permease subunit [Phycisphaerales bacterium]
MKPATAWPRMLGVSAAIAAWEIIALCEVVNPILLPPAHSIGIRLLELLQRADFWLATATTLSTWLLGLLLGSIFGVPIGFLLGFNQTAWRMVEPIVEFVRALPSVVLVPIVAMFFGAGMGSRILATSCVVGAAMIFTAADAASSVRRTLQRLAAAWCLSASDSTWRLYLPASMPHLLFGLRTALPLGLIITVAAEMLVASGTSTGRMLLDAAAVFDTKTFYALVAIIGSIGYASSALLLSISTAVVPWRSES